MFAHHGCASQPLCSNVKFACFKNRPLTMRAKGLKIKGWRTFASTLYVTLIIQIWLFFKSAFEITSSSINNQYIYVPTIQHCLSVRLEYFGRLENFSLIWRRHRRRGRATNFDLCSAHMAIEQKGFFNVPHLQWNGASIHNGHLRGSVTLTPNWQTPTHAITSVMYSC